MIVAAISALEVALFASAILVVFSLLLVVCFGTWWLSNRKPSPSPYTGLPLKRASDLSFDSKERVLRYLFDQKGYDNRMFNLNKAAFCRDTGRIFPDALNWFDVIQVDWSFLQKKFPGSYVSWGSLSKEQQEAIRIKHDSLEGFQTEESSAEPTPRRVEKRYIYLKPGPLYVDLQTDTLVGWKCIPVSDLEVLIVQKPKPNIQLNIS